MSRVAKNHIPLQSGVTAVLSAQEIEVKGPKGTLRFNIHPSVTVSCLKNEFGQYLAVKAQSLNKSVDAIAGTTRALINNMVYGVSEGYKIELELVGVGYRAQSSGAKLLLSLGFSHPIEIVVPEGVVVETPSNTIIIMKGSDKQALGQFAAKIRKLRPPEPYKGKGIKYKNEILLRKEAKKK